MGKIRQFGKELFRRKVLRVVGAYIAIFWLLAQGFASLFPVVGIPDWVLRAFIIAGIAAIPLLAFFSWKYDLVPPQLVRDVKDTEAANPSLSWARVRHDNREAGYVLLSWPDQGSKTKESRFFRPVSIGREPNNDIELADDRVSRHHAVLWAEDGSWHVRDLDSSNGTFIGHVRVNGTAVLPQSCELRFHANGPIVSVHVSKSAATLVGQEPRLR
ncbi:MAG TPA: FHA domain-containing protein [Gammaproteobacteria bacterium]|nr:FHA domain-containing protein [Gammaproteobacteria bacterium]